MEKFPLKGSREAAAEGNSYITAYQTVMKKVAHHKTHWDFPPFTEQQNKCLFKNLKCGLILDKYDGKILNIAVMHCLFWINILSQFFFTSLLSSKK